MKVFVSWSGERSKAVAIALRAWLPQVIQALKPWMSSEDINAGARWSRAIAAELESTSFGIICLTPENLTSDWLHFESGAIAKSVDAGFVAPYLLELTPVQVKGPLSQFQMKQAEKEPTLELLHAINTQLKPPMEQDQLDRAFEKWWPDLEIELSRIEGPKATELPKRSAQELIEEVLATVRAIDQRVAAIRPDAAGPAPTRAPEQTDGQLVAKALGRVRRLSQELMDDRAEFMSARARLDTTTSVAERASITQELIALEERLKYDELQLGFAKSLLRSPRSRRAGPCP